MKQLYDLWDKKLRTGFLVLFAGFIVMLIFRHWSKEITYQEQMMKLQIQDSAVFQLTNGMTLTIYKHEEKDSTIDNSIIVPDASK